MTNRLKLCVFLLAVTTFMQNVADAQEILVDFESASIGDQARSVSDLNFFTGHEGLTSFGDSLIQSVGVGSSNGILYNDLDFPPSTTSPWWEEQIAGFDMGQSTPSLEIGQSISISVDLRITNAADFVADNPDQLLSTIVEMRVRPTLPSLTLTRGVVVPSVVVNPTVSGFEEYGLYLSPPFSSPSLSDFATGNVADIGLIDNTANEISDFFNLEMVVKRNSIDDFGFYGFLRTENGFVLQSVFLGDLDYSEVYDGTSTLFYSTVVNHTASIAHESITFDNFRLIMSEPLIGDVNRDEAITFLDIASFIQVLANNFYLAQADINADGVVDFLDIAPFINLLASQ